MIETQLSSMLTTVICCLTLIGLVIANSDVVTDLPGLHWKPDFKHYSGYLQATGTKKLHYWFVESADNPSKDPVVLWLNGGPGCSSLDGLLSEHGPFLVTDDGITLKKNPYSWNTVANVLYLEAPAGVGFSYSDDKQYRTNDDQVAKDNHAALKYFFLLYPQYKDNIFYITGESYGGIYVPTLSVLVAGDKSFNFKGFAVGNGISNYRMNSNSLVYFAYYHGLYGMSLWNEIVAECCRGERIDRCDFYEHASSNACGQALRQVSEIINSLNIYNVYDECYPASHLVSASHTTGKTVSVLDSWLFTGLKKEKVQAMKTDGPVTVRPPCVNVTAMSIYLNYPDVRKALHIPSELPRWEICSAAVSFGYERVYTNMTAQYLKILSDDKYHILVYNGDVDMACNFLGDEWFVDSLQQKLVKAWGPWYYRMDDGSQQVAGFFKQYKNLNFVTIKGAGHMVPSDKPIPALDMFRSFINDKY